MTTEGTNPFSNPLGTYVTGIGSTIKDLKGFGEIVNVASGSTTLSIVPVITVQDLVIVDTLANAHGVYTTFDFTKDPDTISDEFAIEKTKESVYSTDNIHPRI